jgi:hypothetical protein
VESLNECDSLPPEVLQRSPEIATFSAAFAFFLAGGVVSGGASDWTRHYDAEHQVNYYHNAVTGESTYAPPPGFPES